MATVWEDFLYPLFLLLIGAGVSGVLVGWLTNMWQNRRTERENKLEDQRKQLENDLEDRRQKQQNELEDRRKEREIEVERKRKELEIKADIVSKMNEIVGSVIAKGILSARTRESIPDIKEVLEKIIIDGFIVGSVLQSYFSSEADVKDRWDDFFGDYSTFLDATSLYFVKHPTEDEKSSLERDLSQIKESFPDNKEINLDGLTIDMPFDIELWEKILNLYVDRVEDIITDVLKLPIKVF